MAWQDIAAVGLVFIAACYMARRLIGTFRRRGVAGCGGCPKCPVEDKADGLINLKASTPETTDNSRNGNEPIRSK